MPISIFIAVTVSYLVIGGVAVRVFDRSIKDKANFELALLVWFAWPLFALAWIVSVPMKLIVPDIFQRTVPGQKASAPPDPPKKYRDIPDFRTFFKEREGHEIDDWQDQTPIPVVNTRIVNSIADYMDEIRKKMIS